MKAEKLIIKLSPNERIIAVVPEYSSGPGWSNTPLFVYICDTEDKVRHVCLQPHEQTTRMLTLFQVCAVAHDHMLSAVEAVVYMGPK